MRILFYQWNAFMQKGIENAIKRMEIEYDVFFYQFASADKWECDDVFVDKFTKAVGQYGYDMVFSVNFVPLISNICEDKGIRYISWVYDSPMHIRNIETMKNSCNSIYCFDRGQVELYKKAGINTVEHMPLAVDCDIYDSVVQSITQNDILRYKSQISLVGQLYKSDYSYLCQPLDEYQKGFLEGVINAQSKIYGGYFIGDVISEEFLQSLNQVYLKASRNTFSIDKRELEYTLACEITGRERYLILALMSKRYKTYVYSNDKDDRLCDVRFNGYVDYYTQMPKVFSLSDINLNISLKTIRTGIPLRALDIMGCGGFLLSNYQEELLEWFIPGKEIVVYESVEDMLDKAVFYMQHDDERKAIAVNGYNKVKSECTFDTRLKHILS